MISSPLDSITDEPGSGWNRSPAVQKGREEM